MASIAAYFRKKQILCTPTTAQHLSFNKSNDYGSKESNEEISRSVAIGCMDFMNTIGATTTSIHP